MSEPGQPYQPQKDTEVRYNDFPGDLGRNFLGLASKDNLAPLMVGAGAAGAAYSFDEEVQGYFSRAGRLGPSGEVLGEYPGSSAVIVARLEPWC